MAVMQKHAEQKAANDDRAREMQANREALFKKQMEERKQTGIKVILFLIALTIVFYVAKRRIWARIH